MTNQVTHEQTAYSGQTTSNERMSSWKERLCTFLWSLTILTLPWQTRWFHDASLGGWSWEQGRWSVYASWFLIAATVFAGLAFRGGDLKRSLRRDAKKTLVMLVFGLLGCNLLALLLDGDFSQRIVVNAQWWIQVILLGSFAWVLWRNSVKATSVMRVFVISLLPEVFLGLVQFAAQVVLPMKWLGIAAQDPRLPGVAVIEYSIYRYLRIYGGFPHPNIFGAWLAVGLVIAIYLAAQAQTKIRVVLWSLCSALISVTLLLTFARAAWIAAVIGILVLLFGMRTRRPNVGVRFIAPDQGMVEFQYALVALVCSALLTGSVAYMQRHLLLTRVSSSGRIETKSIDERAQSYADGLRLFLAHPLVGAGPNAELLDLYRLNVAHAQVPATQSLAEPLQPPHNVFILYIDAFGVMGLALCLFVLFRLRSTVGTWLYAHREAVAMLCALGLFDHYLFSSWAGETLCVLALYCTLF